MITKNKETIEKIEQEIEGCFKDETNSPEINELYINLKTELKATIQTSIEWCEDEIEFLDAITKWRSWERMSEFAQENIRNRIKGFQFHLKWLKEEQEKFK